MTIPSQLPISSIMNANATWVRQDLGDMDALITDIRAHGIRKPLLVAADYLMLDGTRRLLAAEKAGLTFVPVVICDTWQKVCDNFDPISDGAYPMRWDELMDLWTVTFKAVHEPERYQRAASAGHVTRAKHKVLKMAPSSGYSTFNEALAAMYREPTTCIKGLRDSFSTMRRAEAAYGWFIQGLEEAIRTMPADVRQVGKARLVKNAVTQLLKTPPDDIAVQKQLLNDAVLRLQRPDPRGPVYFNRKQPSRDRIQATAPPIPVQAVANLVDVLSSVAAEAAKFQNFKATDPQQLRECSKTLYRNMDALYRLRRRIDAYLSETFGEESKEHPA